MNIWIDPDSFSPGVKLSIWIDPKHGAATEQPKSNSGAATEQPMSISGPAKEY